MSLRTEQLKCSKENVATKAIRCKCLFLALFCPKMKTAARQRQSILPGNSLRILIKYLMEKLLAGDFKFCSELILFN